jgi:2-dehydro-3-deoxyphosphogluconate aldolase/(4S)-4-hydroxy-2-oxoglutarate aldolase
MARRVDATVSSLEAVCAHGVVPVVVLERASDAPLLAAALIAGGLPVAEVTFRTAAAGDALRALAEDPALLVGAGTVVRPEQVDEAVAAGARFVVSPGLSQRVVERCREHGVPVVPGVATASEVIAALDLDLDLLKLFPAEACGGVATLKALAAPFPGVRFVPTGGISATNAASYLALPCVAAVGGSWMVAPRLVESGDFDAVTRLAAEAVALVAGARS